VECKWISAAAISASACFSSARSARRDAILATFSMKLTPLPWWCCAMMNVGLPGSGGIGQRPGERGIVVAGNAAHGPAERAPFFVERLIAHHVARAAGDLSVLWSRMATRLSSW